MAFACEKDRGRNNLRARCKDGNHRAYSAFAKCFSSAAFDHLGRQDPHPLRVKRGPSQNARISSDDDTATTFGRPQLGVFSRKQKSTQPAELAVNPAHWIGRKFRTNSTVEESLRHFALARDECYQVAHEEDVRWIVPADASAYRSSQGIPTTIPPWRLQRQRLTDGSIITLAVWAGMVTQADGSGSGGPPIELWFVPSAFDRSPIPIAGHWKMRDPSLSSIGWVEQPLWGAH